MIIKDLGAVTAYAAAVEKGYTGTEEEFATLMASYASVAEEAAESAESAQASATTANSAASTATNKASEATTAAQTATAKAEEAQADADAAALDASQALSAASTATSKASEAAQSASDAVTAKTAAQTAQTAAEGSATTAQTAAQTATQKAAEAAESARTLTIDTTLSQSGQAADAGAVGSEIEGIKSDVNSIDSVLGIEPQEKETKTAYGTVVIMDDVTINAGDSVKWSIPQAIERPIYVYVYDSNDESVTSNRISAGNTDVTLTINSLVENGHISVITYDSVDVTVEIIRAIQPTNRLDTIESELERIEAEAKGYEELVPSYGYSILDTAETGAGAYYWTGNAPYHNSNGSYGTDYTYYIFDVNKNSVYSMSVIPRWLILVDETGGKVSETLTGKMVETGNAVKLYVTIATVYTNIFAISEGYWANHAVKMELAIAPKESNHHGNSLPVDILYFTVGIPEKLYYNNILALPSDKLQCITSCNNQDSHDDSGITITPLSPCSNRDNAVRVLQYDDKLNLVYAPNYTGLVVKALALQNCSALVIGDSTVGSWGLMTERMLEVFDSNDKTLTLLGTQHSGNTDERNLHEGRGGWSAKLYCTEASHGGYTNPFLNNGHFDFAYYMQSQGYTAPDFVIIQLGINDVSGISMDEFDAVSVAALRYEKEMIDSIRAYGPNIKILINPPTTPTSVQSGLSMYYETTIFRNLVIRYAMMLRRLATQYNSNNVRCSNNNLILDTSVDIRDNVHPTDAGFVKLGDEMVNQINCWL